MDCLEFRRQVGAEPFAGGPELSGHRAVCAACARHQDELRAMDRVLGQAMQLDVSRWPTVKAAAGLPAAARTGGVSAPRRWHAVAASIVAGVLVAATLWMSWPEPTLADEVMDHARHEPQAWTATQALPEAAVAEVLEGSGARLGAGAGPVTYAKRCFFGGHRVPHLVVQTGAGPVTVFVLGHREVTAATRLDEQGLAAVVLPAPRGSIAVVGRGLRDPDAVAEEVFRSVEWGA